MGFPRTGGCGGSKMDWHRWFEKYYIKLLLIGMIIIVLARILYELHFH
jgi:hypothetical protein